MRNLEHLSPAQFAKVMDILGGDRHGQEILAAWIAKEKLRDMLNLRGRTSHPRRDKHTRRPCPGVGRAARGREPAISELCGRCGRGRAAIGMDGQLTPCVLGRFLVAGNVKEAPLGDILDGERWRQIVASVPPLDACVTCTPADSDDCNPARKL